MAVVMPSLKSTLMKAAIVGAVGGGASLLFLGGARTVHLAGGMVVPLAAASALGLALSSTVAAYAVPYATQALLKTAPGPTLSKIENMLLEPLMVGAIAIGVEALLSPETMSDTAGIIGVIGLGIGSQVGAAYLSEGLGVTQTILG